MIEIDVVVPPVTGESFRLGECVRQAIARIFPGHQVTWGNPNYFNFQVEGVGTFKACKKGTEYSRDDHGNAHLPYCLSPIDEGQAAVNAAMCQMHLAGDRPFHG